MTEQFTVNRETGQVFRIARLGAGYVAHYPGGSHCDLHATGATRPATADDVARFHRDASTAARYRSDAAKRKARGSARYQRRKARAAEIAADLSGQVSP